VSDVEVVRSGLPFAPMPQQGRSRLHLPVALVILDGWGLGEDGPGNAVTAAATPVMDELFATCPWAPLTGAGLAVGLPDGQMGNSEVGHLNIGAGRVVYQELTRINLAIEDGTFFDNEVLIATIERAVKAGLAVHLMGLLSDGGVHSHQRHLYALVRLAVDRGATDVRIHCFLDGRDTPPESGLGYLTELDEWLRDTVAGDGRPLAGRARVASVMGRYYAMDRDRRWERVELAWRCLVLGEGAVQDSAAKAIEASYAAGVSDEFVVPVPIQAPGVTVSTVGDGDAVVFFNFRPDRARELTRAFVDPAFDGFARPRTPDVAFACLTDYDPTIAAGVAFAKDLPCCTLADVLADAGLRQLHIAETEKYAHVTFFLNGGAEEPKPGEERILVASPRIATYDLKPEMSAREVTDELVRAIEQGVADVYIVNYANLDMVGHTGVYEATVEAVEAVDECLGRVVGAMRDAGGELLVTADHGNAERMVDADGTTPFTAHTTDAVPLVAVSARVGAVELGGILADVAPSLVALIGLACPREWTGHSLLEIEPGGDGGLDL
jgi:2,3-bisphosphoglycerate-independent phosphoglycerate mutase